MLCRGRRGGGLPPGTRQPGARLRRLGLAVALGGATGAAILLLTPARTFEVAAPVLIGGASLVLLVQPTPGGTDPAASREGSWPRLISLFLVAVYVGYFGAAGGILLLAVLVPMLSQPLARTNAVKNVLTGVANGVAAIGFAAFGPVRWAAVLPLGARLPHRRLDRARAGPPHPGPAAPGGDRAGRHRARGQARPERVSLTVRLTRHMSG